MDYDITPYQLNFTGGLAWLIIRKREYAQRAILRKSLCCATITDGNDSATKNLGKLYSKKDAIIDDRYISPLIAVGLSPTEGVRASFKLQQKLCFCYSCYRTQLRWQIPHHLCQTTGVKVLREGDHPATKKASLQQDAETISATRSILSTATFAV